MERYVIIVGAMKSGTTTLFSLLADHPRIAPACPKEPGFFAFEEIHARGYDWYHGLFDFDPARHDYRLEASTDYSKAPFVTGVWDRMAARPGAQFKLIYIMRHPLKRIESHARYVQQTRKEIGQNLSPRPDHGLDAGVSLPSIAMSRYAMQLEAFAPAIAAGDMHLTTLEELKTAPDRVMREIYAFLDLAPRDHSAGAPAANSAESRTTPTALWNRLAASRILMTLGRGLLGKETRERIKARFRKPIVSEGRFRLAPEEEQALSALLSDDLQRLSRDHGVDVARLWKLGA